MKRKYDINIPISQRNLAYKEKKSKIINNLEKQKKINNNKHKISEYKENMENKVGTEDYNNFFIKGKFNNEKINDSISNSNLINQFISLNNSDKTKDSDRQTIINTGREYIFLPKLKKLLFLINKPKEKSLSIVKNNLYKNSTQKENISLKGNKSFINGESNLLIF